MQPLPPAVAEWRHPLDLERTLDEMKGLRETLGYTQDRLAELVGTDRTNISKWENKVSRPDFNNLVILWRILHGLRIEAGVQHHG